MNSAARRIESTDSQKSHEDSITDVINDWVNNDCLKGWTTCHPKGFNDLIETKL